jgi:hypothetical protein
MFNSDATKTLQFDPVVTHLIRTTVAKINFRDVSLNVGLPNDPLK